FGFERVQIQLPIEVAPEDHERSSPEPDVAVLAEAKVEYQRRHPRGDELLLIVEVAESSARLDLTVKARLYASACVPDYWALAIANRWLIIHRHPLDGEYRQVTSLGEQETAALGCGVDASIL